jgi:hypothetical protein
VRKGEASIQMFFGDIVRALFKVRDKLGLHPHVVPNSTQNAGLGVKSTVIYAGYAFQFEHEGQGDDPNKGKAFMVWELKVHKKLPLEDEDEIARSLPDLWKNGEFVVQAMISSSVLCQKASGAIF